MKRRGFLKTIGLAPAAAGFMRLGSWEQAAAAEKTSPFAFSDVPPLVTLTYANGKLISSAAQRRSLARNVARFPIASVISMDPHHSTGKLLPNCDSYRDTIRETNPQIRMLAHLNASESRTPSSPGQRVIHSLGGESGRLGNEPQDNPGTIWFERPRGHVVVRNTHWGRKAIMDFRLQRAQDALFRAMETQYVGGYSNGGADRWWDGLFLDQLIVPGLGWGAMPSERAEMISGLQKVLTRFRNRYPTAIVIGNSPWNFRDINGEVNEGRPKQISEISSSVGHTKPEINLYIYMPKRPASDHQISIQLDRAIVRRAYFAYHYGKNPYSVNPWPSAFSKLLDHYPKWRDQLVTLRLDVS